MASASVSVSRFEKSDLPPICVSSGVPAANVFSVRVGRVSGGIPLNGTVVKVITRLQKLSKIAFVAGLAIFAVGIAAGAPNITALALLALGAAFFLLLLARARLPMLRIHGDQLQMARVHPDFVSALTNPPGKCDGCSSAGSCSVAEMDSCEGVHA